MTRQLGVTLAEGLGSLSHGGLQLEALRAANGTFIRSLSPESRILQTHCSTCGDPGTGSGHWIAELDADSIDRLWRCLKVWSLRWMPGRAGWATKARH